MGNPCRRSIQPVWIQFRFSGQRTINQKLIICLLARPTWRGLTMNHLHQASQTVVNGQRETERRDALQPHMRMLGQVVSCDGGYATISAEVQDLSEDLASFWAIGKLISITTSNSRVVGLVYKVGTPDGIWRQDRTNIIQISVELVGEITEERGQVRFSRGITQYPPPGSPAHRIRTTDLAVIHHPVGRKSAVIGQLSQDITIPAVVSIDDMIKRHFAIVGTTGTGKSTTVSLLLRKIIENRPDTRILVLDPHNEFETAFPDLAINIDCDTLDLPYWLFQHEELCEVVFRGRTGIEEEADALRDLIPKAKSMFNERPIGSPSLLRREPQPVTITADTPLPYRLSDLLKLIEDEIGLLEVKYDRAILKSLRNRLKSLICDPRYHFMFSQKAVEDNMKAILGRIFRIPIEDRPITTFQLSGIPSEVVNAVVSVLCRMAFDMAVWSKGACEILVVCEEAHRYIPADTRLGFFPTRQAIARIAKEGRKYGAFLGIVTQRPGELDPTILSQCSTVFSMRLANEADQEIIRSAIPDSSASTLSFLSSIGNQEAIAFGEGIATPMRIRFTDLPASQIPGAPVAPAAPVHGALNKELASLDRIVSSMRTIHVKR